MRNKFNLSFYIIILYTTLFPVIAVSQDSLSYPPFPGKICPDYVFKNVKYYLKHEMRISEQKGKWLVLDFWSETCISCIKSFPKINDIRNEFMNQVNVLLIGFPSKKIPSLYERFRKDFKLNIPITFDSALFKKWEITSVPHIVIINPKGEVYSVVDKIEPEEIKMLINGETPHLGIKLNGVQEEMIKKNYIQSQPLLINGNGGMPDTAFIFRSILTTWSPLNTRIYYLMDLKTCVETLKKVELLGASVFTLYRYAYFGSLGFNSLEQPTEYVKFGGLPKVVLDIRDSSIFNYDFRTGKNIFNYSCIVPDNMVNVEYFKKTMQKDLQTYFGFNATLENAERICYDLIVIGDTSSIRYPISQPRHCWHACGL